MFRCCIGSHVQGTSSLYKWLKEQMFQVLKRINIAQFLVQAGCQSWEHITLRKLLTKPGAGRALWVLSAAEPSLWTAGRDVGHPQTTMQQYGFHGDQEPLRIPHIMSDCCGPHWPGGATRLAPHPGQQLLFQLPWVQGQACVQPHGKGFQLLQFHRHCQGWRQWGNDICSHLSFCPASCLWIFNDFCPRCRGNRLPLLRQRLQLCKIRSLT